MDLPCRHCRVRPWRRGDEPSLVRHADNRNVWINLRDGFPHPYTAEHARGWIGRCLAASCATHFAIEVGGEAVGGIGFEPGSDVHRHSAEIGFWLGAAWWGRGIMTEAVAAVTERAFESFDWSRIHAGVFAWNPASARVLEKAGYRFEGRLHRSVLKAGRLTDQLLYATVRERGA